MREMKPQTLTREAFRKYGEYHAMINPAEEKLGPPPVEFYRDITRVTLGPGPVCLSVTRVSPRPKVAEKFEYHSYTGEACMPIDGDVVIHIAPAGKKTPVPYDRIESFIVPKGTVITLNPGVWHAAPFAAGDEPVNILVVLPERTYSNDCEVVLFPEEEKIKLDF